MSATALADRKDTEVVQHPATDTGSLLQIISRAASDPAVDIDKMERLMAMHERMVARDAEQAFNSAMTAAQVEMGRIKANKDNRQTKSRYADYAQLDKQLRPIYTKHDFALSFDTMDGAPAGMARVVAHVSHGGGFTRHYHVDMPTDGKGPQGGDVMTKTHATGAAMTYGMRYLLKMIFNVAIGEDDRDGNTVSPSITEDQVEELKSLIDKAVAAKPGTEHSAWLTSFLEYMGVAALLEIPARDFAKGKTAILNAIKQGSK